MNELARTPTRGRLVDGLLACLLAASLATSCVPQEVFAVVDGVGPTAEGGTAGTEMSSDAAIPHEPKGLREQTGAGTDADGAEHAGELATTPTTAVPDHGQTPATSADERANTPYGDASGNLGGDAHDSVRATTAARDEGLLSDATPATEEADACVGTTVSTGSTASLDATISGDGANSLQPLSVAPGLSSVSVRAEWRGHPITSDAWRVGGGQDTGAGDGNWYQRIALRLDNADGVDGHINYQVALQGGRGYTDPDDGLTWTASAFPSPSADGAFAGTTGKRRAIEDIRIWLTGTVAKCYGVHYSVLTSAGREYTPTTGVNPMSWSLREKGPYGPFADKTYEGADGAWPRTAISGAGDVWDSVTYYGYGDVGIRRLTVELVPRSYTHTLLARFENADGSWGDYAEVRSKRFAYGSEVPAWSREEDGTYASSVLDAYVGGYEDTTRHVDVCRRTAHNSIRVRYQNADGSWGVWEDASTGEDRVGATRDWVRERDDVYEAASAHIDCAAEDQTVEVSVARRSVRTVFDPNGGDGGGTVTSLAGATYGASLPTASRAGYRFGGWYTEPVDGMPVASETLVSDATYYARWRETEQLRLVVPVAIHYVAQSDGRLCGPSDGVVAIENRCDVDARVSGIRVIGATGYEIVTGEPEGRQIALDITPGDGTKDELGCYTTGTQPRMGAEWEIGAGSRLVLNGLSGRVGAGDLSSDTIVGAICWSFAAREDP